MTRISTKTIYLDNNATTAPDPRLLDLYTKAAFDTFGNPSSIHSFGQKAKAELLSARETIAKVVGARTQEIVFTATATEALNMLLRGMARGHIITSSVEHAAVFETSEHLKKQGLDVTFLDVGPYGAPTPEALSAAIRSDTRLICLMAVNNETGVYTDINAMAEIAYKQSIPLIVDGVALFGKMAFKLHPGISAICFSGHKFYAPKGAAFAFIRKGTRVTPFITGGHQELGLRAGTENLSGIVAMADAARIVSEEMEHYLRPMQSLREYFEGEIVKLFPTATINGTGPRVANTSNICFNGHEGEALLMYLDLNGIAASMGSACSSGALEPSRVLLNMGLSRKQALASIRFSLSRYTTREEIEKTLEVLSKY
ncbi:MAG: cysteine desulfurase [Verrucomicrobia bacterium]|nr:cysteine desulfurase [Verrucomicrobiota bacterium]MBS0636529.1 cysteine desulfurase [Verrucomicrobiota bacterium]